MSITATNVIFGSSPCSIWDEWRYPGDDLVIRRDSRADVVDDHVDFLRLIAPGHGELTLDPWISNTDRVSLYTYSVSPAGLAWRGWRMCTPASLAFAEELNFSCAATRRKWRSSHERWP
jgi:hypothetical protein